MKASAAAEQLQTTIETLEEVKDTLEELGDTNDVDIEGPLNQLDEQASALAETIG